LSLNTEQKQIVIHMYFITINKSHEHKH